MSLFLNLLKHESLVNLFFLFIISRRQKIGSDYIYAKAKTAAKLGKLTTHDEAEAETTSENNSNCEGIKRGDSLKKSTGDAFFFFFKKWRRTSRV